MVDEMRELIDQVVVKNCSAVEQMVSLFLVLSLAL